MTGELRLVTIERKRGGGRSKRKHFSSFIEARCSAIQALFCYPKEGWRLHQRGGWFREEKQKKAKKKKQRLEEGRTTEREGGWLEVASDRVDG